MKKILTTYIFLTLLFGLFAQEPEYSLYSEIKKQLSADQQNTLSIAENDIKTGDKLRSQANTLHQKAQTLTQQAQNLKRRKRRKALKKAKQYEQQALNLYIESNKKYWNGNTRIYKIYKQDLNKLAQKLSGQDKTDFMQLVNQANNSYSKGKTAMKIGLKQKDPKLQNQYFTKGVQLAKEAVELQQQAYSLYFDKTKPKPKPKISQTQTQVQKTKPAQTQTTTKPQQKVTQKQTQPAITQPYTQPKTVVKHTQQPAYQQPPAYHPTQNQNVYFRVQIAASRVPLSARKLQQIYPGQVYYEYDQHDHYYKYLTIEKFATYQQADCFKQKIGVPGAFIVAYKNGQRVRDIHQVVPQRIPCNSY